MNKRCPDCRIVSPGVDGFGDPTPDECHICGRKLEKYTGSMKPVKSAKATEDLTVEFGDDISEDERRSVIQALQQTDQVKHTDAKEFTNEN